MVKAATQHDGTRDAATQLAVATTDFAAAAALIHVVVGGVNVVRGHALLAREKANREGGVGECRAELKRVDEGRRKKNELIHRLTLPRERSSCPSQGHVSSIRGGLRCAKIIRLFLILFLFFASGVSN